MSKKYYRNQFITKESDSVQNENYWLKEFEKNLSKNAVQSKKVDQNLFDQINSIMNNKSKYTSVSAAVEDMIQRSGLKDYLNSNIKKSEENSNKKIANIESNEPQIFLQKPEIKKTIQNICESTKGNLPITIIIDKLKNIHSKDISEKSLWDEPNLLRYISEVNLNYKSKNFDASSLNLGKIDADDTNVSDDAFAGLTPALK